VFGGSVAEESDIHIVDLMDDIKSRLWFSYREVSSCRVVCHRCRVLCSDRWRHCSELVSCLVFRPLAPLYATCAAQLRCCCLLYTTLGGMPRQPAQCRPDAIDCLRKRLASGAALSRERGCLNTHTIDIELNLTTRGPLVVSEILLLTRLSHHMLCCSQRASAHTLHLVDPCARPLHFLLATLSQRLRKPLRNEPPFCYFVAGIP
jgi:hypothetical protein